MRIKAQHKIRNTDLNKKKVICDEQTDFLIWLTKEDENNRIFSSIMLFEEMNGMFYPRL